MQHVKRIRSSTTQISLKYPISSPRDNYDLWQQIGCNALNVREIHLCRNLVGSFVGDRYQTTGMVLSFQRNGFWLWQYQQLVCKSSRGVFRRISRQRMGENR
jgi:hypothetical protein